MKDRSALERLRADLAELVRSLMDDVPRDAHPIRPRLLEHLGPEAATLPVVRDRMPEYELPNLQLAVDRMVATGGRTVRTLGVGGSGRHYAMLGISDLLMSDQWAVGPAEYRTASVGPDETLPCLSFAVLLVSDPAGPLALLVRQDEQNGPHSAGLAVEAVSPVPGLAERVLAELRDLTLEVDVFRGKVITVESEPMTGTRRVVFVHRPKLVREDVVLPDGVLERIERHVIGPTRHRDALLAAGRHLGRGLLLWGPPGTGKTLTVRYLASAFTEATVIVLTGAALGLAGSFGAVARRLAPAMIVLEDVDLVAEERVYGPFGGSSPVLFDLMNEMSGQGPDTDVTFVLTTNRPDALEPALAARPGRVDLAVEVPLPDADARRRLLDLYARGIELRLDDAGAVVRRTEGVTASFVKELLRKAVVCAAEDGRRDVRQQDVDAALGELLDQTQALTRVLLGSRGDRAATAGGHAWLGAFAPPGSE